MTRRRAHRPSRSRRARPRRRRSRRSPTTRSSPTATPARSSPPTARSTGSACRASTRRACSAACSTARPGFFRFGPFGINHPTARAYEPGTNVLVTTWKTPTGWIVVRDALTMGPRDHEDQITPHTRPPADDDADHMLVRTVECLDGQRRGRARLRAGLRLRPRRRRSGRSSTAAATRPTRPAPGRRSGSQSDLALGIEGDRVRARHVLEPGDRAYCALSWAEELAAPQDVDEAEARIAATTRFWRAWLERRPHPRPPLARPDPALGAHDQGPDLHADRRDGRRADDLAARDAGRRAQLGLPLHLDARHDLHAAGAALAQPRLGGRRVHAVRRRPRADRGRRRCRSCTGSTAGAT